MISIIIPTYNEQNHVEALLSSLERDIDEQLEVIVVDGGSTDCTLELVKHFAKVKLLQSPKGRALQMNTAALESQGQILFFLHADSKLPKCWKEKILHAFSASSCIAGTFYLQFDKNSFWYNLYSRFSRINNLLFTYGDQGIFIKTEVFNQIGMFPVLPIMEDYELLRQIKKVGRLIKLDAPITTSARKFKRNGVLVQQFKNILIILLHRLGLSPALLAKWYNQ